jgi:protein-disulfide isomerase
MKISSAFVSNLVTGVLVACALLVTGVVVRQQFFPPATNPFVSSKLDGWQGLLRARPAGNGALPGKLAIVEFSDYQCPFCRDLEGKLEAFEAAHPGSLSVTQYEYPLVEIHPHAMRAALASKCASTRPGYPAFRHALFENSSNLDRVDYERLATRVGIGDVSDFRACLDDPATMSAVQRDVALAKQLGFKGTPILVVEGDVISGSRDERELHEYLSRRL